MSSVAHARGTVPQMSFVEFFVSRLAGSAGSNAKTADEIAQAIGVTRVQVQAWLKTAME